MPYQVLGPVQAFTERGTAGLGGPKQRLVLALLLVDAGRTVTDDRLIDGLWGDKPPDGARHVIQTYVSELRKVLDDEIHRAGEGYRLPVDPAAVDAHRFESLVQTARRQLADMPSVAASSLREALALWRGEPFEDLGEVLALQPEIHRLQQARLGAVEDRIQADLDSGRHQELAVELDSATRLHPYRERLYGLLMLALYRCGRQAESLEVYDRARKVLADELGIDPSPDLQRLHERILRQDPTLDLGGEPLRGYRLLEQIGEGAFGIVYRGLQPHVGREVAVKAIHAELANHPDFVRRFEREAQIVARLEHPNIVPLYDYWREPDAAYFVMRFLRGGSLEELLDAGPLEPSRAASIVDQVASALAAAHRQGVVHRDVKPGNILLDEEGNAYLTDFGVALDVGSPERSSGTMMRGTPAYLSPEQIRLEPATPGSDVYSLGVVLFEMLTGGHPFPETSLTALLDRHLREALPSARRARSELPAAIDDVIARATAKDADRRFADIVDVATAFRAALEGAARDRAPVGKIRNPYKGLRAFLEADAGDFFGREALTDRLLHRLREPVPGSRFLAVVGPSGSGKSSVVRAGLLPALRRGALASSDRWYVVEVFPGPHPIQEFETALLGVAVEPPPSLADELEHDELGLVRAAERVLPDPDAELLIVLDQLEEVFALVKDGDERAHVLGTLEAAARDPRSRVRVVTTLRADFFDVPLSIRGFGDLLAARTEAITPMSPEELERAIVAPADRVGLAVEPRLLAVMIADVADRPGALPLLQYALTELTERTDGGALTLGAYRRIGGVVGALARRADHLFDALTETAREACRELFLRLVSVGEGSEETRRRIRRSELVPLADARAMEDVVESFGRHRLLSFDRDPATREPTVEIAHESLLGAWARLREWIEEAKDDIRTQRRVASAAAEWEASGRDPSFLLRDARLEQVLSWVESSSLAASAEDRAFMDASAQRREEEAAARLAAQEREQALERRSMRRLRTLVAVGVAAALVATSLTVVAINQRRRAEREARSATARDLASGSIASLDVDPNLSILLALEAVETTRAVDGTVLREAEEALHRAVQASRLTLSVPGSLSVDFSPDGRRFVTLSQDETTAIVWNVVRGERVLALGPTESPMSFAIFDAKGSRIATTHSDGTATVWNAMTGDELLTLTGHQGIVIEPAFSPDGRWLATSGVEDGTARVWDLRTGAERWVLEQPVPLGLAFSPDSASLAVAGDDGTRIWDVSSGRLTRHLEGFSIQDVVFDPDGSRVIAGEFTDMAKVWDIRTGREELTIFSGTSGVDITDDGRLIATGDVGGTAQVWELGRTGARELATLSGASAIWNVAFSPDGTKLLTGGPDGPIQLWDVTNTGEREWWTASGARQWEGDVAFSPDGRVLAASDDDGLVRIRDADTGRLVMTLRGHVGYGFGETLESQTGGVYDIEFSPDGTRIATASNDQTARLWDSATGAELHTLVGHEARVWSLAFSPDGRLLVTGGWDGSAKIWDVATGRQLRSLELEDENAHVGGVDVSPDGTRIAMLSDTTVQGKKSNSIRLWDVGKGRPEWDVSWQLVGPPTSVEFSPDGTRLAAGRADGTLQVLDAESGRQLYGRDAHAGGTMFATFSPDGSRIASSGVDGDIKLWNAETGDEELLLTGHTDFVFKVAFSPDGTRLASISPDGTIRVWALRIEDLIRLARDRLTRGFTTEECKRYQLGDCPAA